MVFRAVVGHSNDPDTESAAAELVAQCRQHLHGELPQAGILFAAPDFDHLQLLNCLTQAFPEIQLIGGTTDAEMSSQMGFQEDSCTLLLLSGDAVEISVGLGQGLSKDMAQATKIALDHAKTGLSQAPTFCLTFADGLTSDSGLTVQALRQELGDTFPIAGGITGDQMEFQQTYQFCHNATFSNAVTRDAIVVMLFSGPLLFSHSMAQGWTPLSQKGQITEVKGGQQLVTINDQPAAHFYTPYLGGKEPGIEYPLAIFESDSDEFYLRAPIATDFETGIISALAHFPETGTVQIAHANRPDLIKAAGAGAEAAMQDYPGNTPAVALLFSCCTRRLLLGTKTGEELTVARAHIPANIPIIGFYTYGEIVPLRNASPAKLHHETFATVLLGVG